MGIPLDIFSLHQFGGEGAGCRHYLLLRVGRPGFSNADEGEYARAVEEADEKRSALIAVYEAEVLAAECAGRHAVSLAGELQARPVGDELCEGRGGFFVELWVAETRYGRPWVVLGTAAGEEEFWREVGRDEDLSSLGATGPPLDGRGSDSQPAPAPKTRPPTASRPSAVGRPPPAHPAMLKGLRVRKSGSPFGVRSGVWFGSLSLIRAANSA